MIHIEYVSRHLSVYSSLPMIVMCYALQSALWMFTCLFFFPLGVQIYILPCSNSYIELHILNICF